MTHRKTLGFIILFAAALLVSPAAGQLTGSGATDGAVASGPDVLPPVSRPFGTSYGDWAAAWWQWTYSQPAGMHPLTDTAGCDAAQSDRVWFLGGTFTPTSSDPSVVVGEADRDCPVPAGKALFFPIVNAECNTFEASATEEQLRECANFLADHIRDLQVTVDGTDIDHLGLYRAESPLFTIGPLPDDNLLMAPAGTTAMSVSDGFWIMLPPLPAGEHQLHFSGAAVFTVAEDGFDFTFTLDIDYALTVGRESR